MFVVQVLRHVAEEAREGIDHHQVDSIGRIADIGDHALELGTLVGAASETAFHELLNHLRVLERAIGQDLVLLLVERDFVLGLTPCAHACVTDGAKCPCIALCVHHCCSSATTTKARLGEQVARPGEVEIDLPIRDRSGIIVVPDDPSCTWGRSPRSCFCTGFRALASTCRLLCARCTWRRPIHSFRRHVIMMSRTDRWPTREG